MDVSNVHQVKGQNMKRGRRNTRDNNKKSLKVVYISTPMKVNTSASTFKDIVQELTGRDSDVSRFMDFYEEFNANLLEKSWERQDDQDIVVSNNSSVNGNDNGNDDIRPTIRESQTMDTGSMDQWYGYSLSSSESLLDSFDDMISSQMVEELEQMFPSALLGYESCISH